MNIRLIPYIFALAYLIFNQAFFSNLIYTDLGISVTIFLFIEYVRKWGTEVPIKELILLLAASQWIVGAKLAYGYGKVHHKYFMYVDEATYMSYVVPGFIAFTLGIYTIYSNLKIDVLKPLFENDKKNKKLIAYSLITIGLTAEILDKLFSIHSLSFIFYLLNILLYIGISYLFFIFPKYKYHLFFFTVSIAFFRSLQSGMFHELLLITTFLSYFILPKKVNMIEKIAIILFGFFFMYTIQIVKHEFRKIVYSGKSTNPVSLFINLAGEELISLNSINSNKEFDEENANTNNRLNQGWIISRVLSEIPSQRDFLGGATITEAIEASLVPRFISPNKAGTNQSLINFTYITGLPLAGGTSMGLSIIAEFYANYGIIGGWVAMFIYGLFLSFMIRLIKVYLGNNSSLINLWIILFFFQVIKAETDFMKVFNYIVKSTIIFIVLKYYFSFFKIPLFRSLEKKDSKSVKTD